MAKSTIMMPFFLTMPISRMMPIMRDHRQIGVRDHQHQQRADAGRGQRGQDGQRQDVALVQDAEDDVDGDQRRRDQIGLARQRGLERLRGALERALQRERRAELRCGSCRSPSTASPSAAPGARLNEIVTAGNWL